MNENEINSEEFSGASASSNIYRVARAVAIAVATAYKTVYRSASASISNQTTVTGWLRNQYNGLVNLASTVAQSTTVSAAWVKLYAISVVISTATYITASASSLKRIASAIVVPAATIIGVLRNQFGDIINLAVGIANTYTVKAKAIAFYKVKSVVTQATQIQPVIAAIRKLVTDINDVYVELEAQLRNQFNGLIDFSTTISSESSVLSILKAIRKVKAVSEASYSISAALARLRKIKALVTQTTVIAAVLGVVKKAKAVISATYSVKAALAGLAKSACLVLYVTVETFVAKARYKAESIVTSTSTITANLKSSTNAPASPENTFQVPPDSTTYDVENS